MSRYTDLRQPHLDADPHCLVINLPASLADVSAAQLIELLGAITAAIEDRYADQLCRYYGDPPDERQYPLWDDDPIDEHDLPF